MPPKHLLKCGPVGLQPWLQASGTVQICLLCVPLAVKQQDVLQLTLGVCLKLGFWIQGPTASGFLLFFYYFYFPPPFKTGRVNVVTFCPLPACMFGVAVILNSCGHLWILSVSRPVHPRASTTTGRVRPKLWKALYDFSAEAGGGGGRR